MARKISTMKINNEEIERLLRVVSESLRLSWEKTMINGQSLLTAKKERDDAFVLIERNDKKSKRIMILILLLGALFMFVSNAMHPFESGIVVWAVVIQVVLLLLVFVGVCLQRNLEKKNSVARRDISECEDTFTWLGESVDSLNCLGVGNPYWDIIDEPQVKEKLVRAAYRVLDAQASFESCRVKPNVDRYSVIRAGNWIEHCEGMFNRIWDTSVHDFGLTLDKEKIFKQASKELEKDKVKKTSDCPDVPYLPDWAKPPV